MRSTGMLPDSAIKGYQAALRHFESLPVAEEVTNDAALSKVDAITSEFTSLVATDAVL